MRQPQLQWLLLMLLPMVLAVPEDIPIYEGNNIVNPVMDKGNYSKKDDKENITFPFTDKKNHNKQDDKENIIILFADKDQHYKDNNTRKHTINKEENEESESEFRGSYSFDHAGPMRASYVLSFSHERLSWDDAVEACASKGYRLVTLENIANILVPFIKQHFGNGWFWVGGSDIVKDGTWKYITGVPLDHHFPWAAGEPNNYGGKEDCLMANFNGGYNDQSCSSHLRYICNTGPSDPKLWRDDGRCGPSYPLPDGRPSQCWPQSLYPCCSPYGWCGNTARHCNCATCINYSPLRKEIAIQFAPKLRFDSKQGNKDLCFPSSANGYYIERKDGKTHRICNTNYATITSGRVPTYWKAMECGTNLHINYWFFYSWQEYCFGYEGEHHADWENIIVKVENYKTNHRRLGAVMFYQHEGRYTKTRGNYEVDGTHPIVYVGKNSHGSYHDDGGSGGCCYFEDFRNPGRSNKYMKTWLNLEELRRDASAPAFMQEKNIGHYFNGIAPPLDRDWINHLCSQKTCEGSKHKHCGTCGCYKSEFRGQNF